MIRYFHKKAYLADGTEIDQLLWYPAADQAYDLRFWYELMPTPLTDAAHEPLLPPKFRNIIATGVLARMTELQGVQVENAVIWPGLYRSQLDALKSFNRKWYEDAERNKRETAKPYML